MDPPDVPEHGAGRRQRSETPKTPAVEPWPPGMREAWLKGADGFQTAYEPLPRDTD